MEVLRGGKNTGDKERKHLKENFTSLLCLKFSEAIKKY